ncbi:MAG: hypothetical protein LBM69_03490 [Lachnospiraceae bacterium]|nr:hypothetical protein [Lachnospiraceae bacterium]
MSDPVKKYSPSETNIESDSTKIKPAPIEPLTVPSSFEYLNLPALRFIGVDANSRGGDWGNLWAEKREFLPALENMSDAICPQIPQLCGLQHSANGNVNVEDHLVVGYFFRADTPAPDGYDYMDFPALTVGFATFDHASLDDNVELRPYVITRDRILNDGKIIPYPIGYWSCEVYYDAAPLFDDDSPAFKLGYMFPVCEKE